MFTTRTFIAIAILSTLSIAGAAGQANAASFDHIDSLALKLTRQSSELYHEFRLHYRHAAHYRHLMSDAAGIYRTARHIHVVAHRGSLQHMDEDLRELDRQFHHLEDLLADIHDDEHHDHFGHGGHIHGDVRHVRRLMRQMEDTIHHLRDDIRELLHDHHDGHGHPHDVYYRHPRSSSPVISRTPHGISVRTGSFGFRIGL